MPLSLPPRLPLFAARRAGPLGAALLVLALPAPTEASLANVGTGHAAIAVYEADAGSIQDDVRSIARSADGTLLVGSNVLAAYDGDRWQRIEVSHAYGFRALAAAPHSPKNRVWVAAIGEVGFAEKDSAERWHYTSLLPQLAAAGLPLLGDVWSVRSLGNGAVWATDEHLLRWTPPSGDIVGHFDVWHLPAKSRLAAFGGGERVWIHQEGTGLLELAASGDPKLALPEASLPATPVTWLVAPNGDSPNLRLGLNDAAYLWDESRGLTRDAPLSQALQRSRPTDAVSLPDGRIAVATFDRGIVVAGARNEPPQSFSTDRGLPDASVYSLLADGRRLWAATPQGLARIDGPGLATLFDAHDALADGRTIDVVSHNNETFVLTTHDLLRVQRGGEPRLEPVLHAPDAFTDAAVAPGSLWVSGLGGLWQIASHAPPRQEVFAPNDVLQICASRRYPGEWIYLEGYNLKLLHVSEHGGWATHDLNASVADTPVSLVEDRDTDVWISTMRQGVARFRWSTATPAAPPRLLLEKVYRPGSGLPADAGRLELVFLHGQLFAFSDAGVLALRADKLAFETVPALGAFIGIAASQPDPTQPDSAWWLVRPRMLADTGAFAVVRVTIDHGGIPDLEFIGAPGLDALGPATRIASADGALWVGGRRGLLRIDTAALAPAPVPSAPRVQSHRLDRSSGSFGFRLALPMSVDGEPHFYQMRLGDGEAAWSIASREPVRNFPALSPGRHRIEVRALDRFGRPGPAVAEEFVVLAPWWKTGPAFAAYAALLVLAVAGAARWRLLRLRLQNERLNRLVAERTREIALASTAKSEFLDNISHEIRNPLNGLTGLLALLKEDRLDPRERELTRSLKSVASTLHQTFEEVLQFSKLEYGYGRIERRRFLLRPLLEEILALFAAPAGHAGCTLQLHWPEGLVDGFEGDPGKIKTVVSNLVGNALKYAPGAPVDVRVGQGGGTNGMAALFIDVADRGPGIPSEEQELIFRKFVRGRRARESEIPGTGLGLATCHMLAKLMNGSIGVDSSPGRGSTFHLHVTLPRAALSNVHPNRTDPSAAPAIVGPVLIVEDEAYNRVVLQEIVRELGLAADVAGSAAEARQCLATRDDYRVVILDWELPDGNGGEIARSLRVDRTGHRPVVLAATAHDSDEMRRRCLESGMDGVLTKPYNADALRYAIAAASSASGAGDNRPAPANDVAAAPSAEPDGLDLTAFGHFAHAYAAAPNEAWERFVGALDSHLAVISRAFSVRDPAMVSAEAHRLRALAGLIRATALNRAAARLELLAREGKTCSECADTWIAVQEAAARLKEQLAALAPRATPRPLSHVEPA